MITSSGEQGPMDDRALLEEAAGWLARLHELGVSTTPEFEAWRRSAPAHQAAWARVEAPWRQLGEQATAPELMTRRGAALERARQTEQRHPRDRRTPIARPRLFAAIASVLVAVLTLGVFYVRGLPTTYRTDIGERRIVALEDGSSVMLDSGSELSVRYTPRARELTLARGQAHFDVAHNIERPFSVTAGDRTVIATGTSFDVDLVGEKVIVTLLEGHVVVIDRSGRDRSGGRTELPPEGVRLEPGERLVAAAIVRGSPGGAPAVQQVSLERATAWQAGQLVFDDETLAAAVESINRYSRTRVTVADPVAAAERFSGVFHEGDTQAFIDTVTRYLGLEAKPGPDDSIELRRRP